MPSTEIVAFTPEHLPAVTRFTRELWPWPEGDAFERWRWLDCTGFHHAYLALRGGECLALICAFERELAVDGERRPVIDGFDWATRPQPGAGTLGFFVMQALLKAHRDSVLGFSGTEISMALRAKLGFVPLEPIRRCVLPLAAEGRGARGLATGAVARTWFRPRRRRAPRGGRVVVAGGVGPEIDALYTGDTGHAAVLLPSRELYAWLAAYPGPGHLVPLHFFVGGELRGWALGRVYYDGDRVEAALLECFAPRPTVELYTWMVSEMTVRLAAHGPSKLRAAASCPTLATALSQCRFLARRPIPLDYLPRGDEPPGEPRHLTWNGADFPCRPYPRWDLAGAP